MDSANQSQQQQQLTDAQQQQLQATQASGGAMQAQNNNVNADADSTTMSQSQPGAAGAGDARFAKVAVTDQLLASQNAAVQKREGSSGMPSQSQDGLQKPPDHLSQMPGAPGQHSQASAMPYALASASAQGQNNFVGEKLNMDDAANQNSAQFQLQGPSAAGVNSATNKLDQRQPFGMGQLPQHVLLAHQQNAVGHLIANQSSVLPGSVGGQAPLGPNDHMAALRSSNSPPNQLDPSQQAQMNMMGNVNSQIAAGNAGSQAQENSADLAVAGASGPLRQNQATQPNQHQAAATDQQQMNSKIKKDNLAQGNAGKDQRLLIQNIMQNSGPGPFNNAMGGGAPQTGQQPSGSSQPPHGGDHHQKQMMQQTAQQALDQVHSTEMQNQAIRSSQLAASSGLMNSGASGKDQEMLRQQQVQYLRDSELQKRYQGYFGISTMGPGGAAGGVAGGHDGIMQQNMLSDGDISAAMFNANSHVAGPGAMNARIDGGEQADGGATQMQLNQMMPGRRSLLAGNNNSAFSFADSSTSSQAANASNNVRQSQVQNPLTSQQIQMLQKQNMNRRDNNRVSQVNLLGGANPGANPMGQLGSPFAPVTGMLSTSTEQQQQMQSINPNFNEVMSFDPVDGRDLRGRGRSRDASNSRIVGMHHQVQNPFNQNMLSQLQMSQQLQAMQQSAIRNNMGANCYIPGQGPHPYLPPSSSVNALNMDINDQMQQMNLGSNPNDGLPQILQNQIMHNQQQKFGSNTGSQYAQQQIMSALCNMNQPSMGQSSAAAQAIPIFCSLHGKQLEFFCFDCNQRVCIDCISLHHQGHKVDYFAAFFSGNFESLEFIKTKAHLLHLQRQAIHDHSYRQFKTKIRQEVLNLKQSNVQAIEDASSRILQLVNKGEMRNFEKEMEIYQNFVNNKIINFLQRIQQTIDGARAAQQNQLENGLQMKVAELKSQSGLLRHQVQHMTVDKEKVDNFDKEVQAISDQITFKKEYFEKIQDKILNKIDLSSFKQVKVKILQAERSLEQYSKDNRIAVFVPNRKQIIMHDLKYFTSKTIDLKHVEHPFGNFSTILQCSMNGKIYICGGKQRRKLFEFDERNWTLIERSEMINGRSNHAFVEIPMTGELIAIGGWDGERAMAQTEGFSIRSNQWKSLPKLAEERHSLTACLLGQSFIYAIGGSSAINYGSSLCTIERINFAQPNYMQQPTWELIFLNGEFSDQKRSQLGSIAISDDQIMIFGGFLDTDLTNQCYIIDHNRQTIQKMKKPSLRAVANGNEAGQNNGGQSSSNQNRQGDEEVPGGRDASERRVGNNIGGSSQQARPDSDSLAIRQARGEGRNAGERPPGGSENSRIERDFDNQRQAQGQNEGDPQNVDPNGGAEGNVDGNALNQAAGDGAQLNQEQQFVTMKKSKKFIKFKDYIIKLPNSMGLFNAKQGLDGDLRSLVEQNQPSSVHGGAGSQPSDIEGPGAQQNFGQQNSQGAALGEQVNNFGFNQGPYANLRRDKGYSIYVVDDEHEIHRFDMDTYEWTIISTTKDLNE